MTIHNYRLNTLRWGHNLLMFGRKEESGLMEGYVIGPRVKKGDTLRWSTAYGYAEGEILDVEWSRDPDDMYWIKIKDGSISRYDDTGILIDNDSGVYPEETLEQQWHEFFLKEWDDHVESVETTLKRKDLVTAAKVMAYFGIAF